MSFIAVAIGGAAAIAGGVTSYMGSKAQAQSVKDSSAAAIAEQQRQYDQNRADLAPWRNNGGAANNELAYLMGVGPQYGSTDVGFQIRPDNTGDNVGFVPRADNTGDLAMYGGRDSRFAQTADGRVAGDNTSYSPQTAATTQYVAPDPTQHSGAYGSLLKDFSASDFQTDPGYEFRLSEGSKALQRSAAANGSLFSGGTLKALDQYNQGFASNEYSNAYNRFNTNKLNRYNMLAGLSQGGQQAANSTVAAGSNAANNISNITVNAGEQIGNARASGYAGIGQAINGGLSNGLSMYLASQGSMKPKSGSGIGIYN